jgi:hypothetical protein
MISDFSRSVFSEDGISAGAGNRYQPVLRELLCSGVPSPAGLARGRREPGTRPLAENFGACAQIRQAADTRKLRREMSMPTLIQTARRDPLIRGIWPVF